MPPPDAVGSPEFHEVVVVEAGFGGLDQARALRAAGIGDVVPLAEAPATESVGGTSRDGTDPGRGTEMTGATWDEAARTWTVHIRDPEAGYAAAAGYECRFLVAGVGALQLPSVPALPGAERFGGPALDHLTVTGRDGRRLRTVWAERGMAAHHGITVSDFPNLFLLLGPDTALGHRSVGFVIECQVRYVAQAITAVRAEGCGGLDVRAEVAQRSHADVQRRRWKGIWTRWPGTARYWWLTRRFDPEEYEFFGRAADAEQGRSGVAEPAPTSRSASA